ncbi:MAG: OpgC domain-containing protein [Alphaproteobacteria bacterium]|nr:OpgC domain-containing protein [Alphaproteobacteria bacterium]
MRVDFFRGAALLIIFVAHVPGNVLGNWIPARFGLSDAAHMFVFISGYAAAIAFGGTFLRQGFLTGSARIAFRCLQLYAAHIGLFVAVATLCAFLADTLGGFDYARHLNIASFFAEPANVLVGLFTLAFVPTFFDILPLYMVVLAMVPAAMLLARLHPWAPAAVSITLWLAVQVEGFGLPAGYAENALWGFNPFAWQLIFFTGYSLSIGWVRLPRMPGWVVAGAAIYLAIGVVISVPAIYGASDPLAALRDVVLSRAHKPNLDILQYGHFLASACVALALLEGRIEILTRPWAAPFVKVGQQALIVFVAGMTLSHLGGMVLQTYGTGAETQVLVNLCGFAALIALAYAAAWFKNPPWKAKAAATARPAVSMTVVPTPAEPLAPPRLLATPRG